MNFYIIFILITIFLMAYPYLNSFIDLKDKIKNNSKIVLKAKRTHSNRGLYFTKNKEYIFWRRDNNLYTDSDDLSRDRDTYVFYKEELNNDFLPTDDYSEYVLKKLLK